MDEGEEISALWAKIARGTDTEGRRQREARAMSPATRRVGRQAETKTAQLNMRVTPSLKKRLTAIAIARGVSIVELIESAVESMEGNT